MRLYLVESSLLRVVKIWLNIGKNIKKTRERAGLILPLLSPHAARRSIHANWRKSIHRHHHLFTLIMIFKTRTMRTQYSRTAR